MSRLSVVLGMDLKAAHCQVSHLIWKKNIILLDYYQNPGSFFALDTLRALSQTGNVSLCESSTRVPFKYRISRGCKQAVGKSSQ